VGLGPRDILETIGAALAARVPVFFWRLTLRDIGL
jgi:hypothetical protein